MGRPPKFGSPEALTALADAYIAEHSGKDEMPTVSGLCLALDCCRDTLWAYAKKPEFSDAIKRARTQLELAWEQRLAGPNCTGAIFWLKNQGWKDKVETEHRTRVQVVWPLAPPPVELRGRGETQ